MESMYVTARRLNAQIGDSVALASQNKLDIRKITSKKPFVFRSSDNKVSHNSIEYPELIYDVWQYVRYNQPDGGTFYGYVYSAQLVCDEVVPNSGEKVPRPSPSAPKETSPSLSLSRNGAIALAVTLCVPAGMIMLVLFYRPDSKRTPRHSK